MTSLESVTPFVPARNRRQAMEWSLVLLSQEISTVIQEVDGRWGLCVERADHDRAVEILREYQRENRGWRWKRQTHWPGFSFHFGAAVWCLALAGVHVLAGTIGVLNAAAMMDSDAVMAGAWWRLFTAVALHADPAHLMANLTTGFLLLGLAMGRYGAAFALLAAYLAGVAGNLAGLILHLEPYQGLGASGMVMGGLGLLAIQTLSIRRARPVMTRYLLTGISAGVLLLLLIGVNPNTDVSAHVGGFLAGLLLGGLHAIAFRNRTPKPAASALAWVLLILLMAVPWALALR